MSDTLNIDERTAAAVRASRAAEDGSPEQAEAFVAIVEVDSDRRAGRDAAIDRGLDQAAENAVRWGHSLPTDREAKAVGHLALDVLNVLDQGDAGVYSDHDDNLPASVSEEVKLWLLERIVAEVAADRLTRKLLAAEAAEWEAFDKAPVDGIVGKAIDSALEVMAPYLEGNS